MTLKQTLVATSLLSALAAAQANPGTYTIDPTHTFVSFEIGQGKSGPPIEGTVKRTAFGTLERWGEEGALLVPAINSAKGR